MCESMNVGVRAYGKKTVIPGTSDLLPAVRRRELR